MICHRSKAARSFTRHARIALAFAAALTWTAAGGARAQTITELGPLPGDEGSQSVGVSANGMAAAGLSWGPSGNHVFRWSAGRGAQDQGTLPGGVSNFPWAVSGNGEAVSGSVFLESGLDRPVLWTRARGAEDLGTLPNALYGASATATSFTGNEVTGVSTTSEGLYHAFRWTRQRGMQDLGTLPGGVTSYGYGISGDGAVVTGLADTAEGTVAVRWTAREGMRSLPSIAPGDWAMGWAANRNGSVIVGFSGSNAAVWRDGTVRDLGTLPGGSFSAAYAVSGDGQVVAGICDNAAGALVACLWTDRLGLVDLNEHLAALGVNLSGWTLDWATGLSADGSAISGNGTRGGASRAWLARVPSIDGGRGDARGRPVHPHTHRCDSPVPRLRRLRR